MSEQINKNEEINEIVKRIKKINEEKKTANGAELAVHARKEWAKLHKVLSSRVENAVNGVSTIAAPMMLMIFESMTETLREMVYKEEPLKSLYRGLQASFDYDASFDYGVFSLTKGGEKKTDKTDGGLGWLLELLGKIKKQEDGDDA